MENSIVKAKKGDQVGEEDLFCSLIKDIELSGVDSLGFPGSKLKRMVRRIRSKHILIFNGKNLRNRRISFQELFLQRTRGLSYGVPKQIVSLDEKYLRRCLELINMSASKAVPCIISPNISSTKMGVLSDDLNLTKCRAESTSDLARFVIECPLSTATSNVDITAAGQWIIGAVTESQSMINILKSPLFRQYGTIDSNDNMRSMIDVEGLACSEVRSSPVGLSVSSSNKLQKETALPGHHRNGSETGHNRFFSISSTNSSCSGQSSASTSFAPAPVSQGMLQCTWKCGIPQYVFSIDNQREIYVAKLLKVDSSDDKPLEYIYLFYSGASGQTEHGARHRESPLVGKMKVSSSFALCPNNLSTMETEFVLFGAAEDPMRAGQTSNHDLKKGKRFARKVAKAFRANYTSSRSFTSKFGGTSTVFEDYSLEPSQDVCNNHNQIASTDLLDSDLPPHLELAAIVVRDHPRNNDQKAAEAGGWGMKFLKKLGVKQTNAWVEASVSSACCLQSVDRCSSVDVILPAGFHGGPWKTKGGPSGLIQRWKSDGSCDCGGWDIGCPLTVLNPGTNKEVGSPPEMQGECKSFDLFRQGSDQSLPTLKMVNIHDGLYYVHFRSAVSALQSFSIAVAIMHTRTPTLRPKNV